MKIQSVNTGIINKTYKKNNNQQENSFNITNSITQPSFKGGAPINKMAFIIPSVVRKLADDKLVNTFNSLQATVMTDFHTKVVNRPRFKTIVEAKKFVEEARDLPLAKELLELTDTTILRSGCDHSFHNYTPVTRFNTEEILDFVNTDWKPEQLEHAKKLINESWTVPLEYGTPKTSKQCLYDDLKAIKQFCLTPIADTELADSLRKKYPSELADIPEFVNWYVKQDEATQAFTNKLLPKNLDRLNDASLSADKRMLEDNDGLRGLHKQTYGGCINAAKAITQKARPEERELVLLLKSVPKKLGVGIKYPCSQYENETIYAGWGNNQHYQNGDIMAILDFISGNHKKLKWAISVLNSNKSNTESSFCSDKIDDSLNRVVQSCREYNDLLDMILKIRTYESFIK